MTYDEGVGAVRCAGSDPSGRGNKAIIVGAFTEPCVGIYPNFVLLVSDQGRRDAITLPVTFADPSSYCPAEALTALASETDRNPQWLSITSNDLRIRVGRR